ncbi:DUF4375 domain-containing protein [Mesorhizobium sp. M7A.F.Ca.US.014.04.1.1]|uniref:DNA mimic protein DMP19 C-terminal domain-containing protein n=3 Tax=Mesorhizobium TaxID=68287 RepID=E8TLL3_MESCW|nr:MULTISPECIES: DUF4375 domain-containing protein [Mesorhizobium]RVA55723.1 DUF4375 domain-containing protein [Mesorhizobium sp. M7A.F.Ca.US.001.01.1.1]ADV13889.1 hypothetical protein Mesci_4780 [Mesorhizobium ciceri biovar biserrulae WSM1271]AMX92189.1 hypothetical protein A4R28_03170 [Mesorhizobium ciceri]ARP66460.1 hypothetical protein A9K65_026275 [Mesorhizobium sp. WSM1497]MDF3153162.1 DUF4375 domain-containing protein [Mesorhizobium sp. XAP10]
MFGIFSRKKRLQQSTTISAHQPEQPTASPRVTSIVVPFSAVERAAKENYVADLVTAVMDFVTAMFDQGLYKDHEIPPSARQFFHAYLYGMEVANGGHSQFIHNYRDHLDKVTSDVHLALAGMRAENHLAILKQMVAWVREHPKEAEEQTGFEGGRADFLDGLDDLFYKEEDSVPMLARAVGWIASWPELEIVDDAECQEATLDIVMANSRREPRLRHRSVFHLKAVMTSRLEVGIGLACAALPQPEVKLGLGKGRMLDIDGEKQMTFPVVTNAGRVRLCVVTPTHAAAYQYLAADGTELQLDLGPVDSVDELLGEGAPRVGLKLSHVGADSIATVIELADEYGAPAALDLLLRRAGIDTAGAVALPSMLIPSEGGSVVSWTVAADGRLLFLVSSPNGSALLRSGAEDPLADAHRLEIEEHFVRAEADGAN